MHKSVGAAVITKNHESYIEECIDSLLSQEQKLDHIVISDDASQDDTLKKLQKFKKFKNITISKNESSIGPSLNSNKALSLVNTDFVLYTSGDDVSKLERSRIQVEHLEGTNYSCVINEVENIIQGSEIDDTSISTFSTTKSIGLTFFSELFWNQNFLNASASCFSSKTNFRHLFKPNLLHLQDFDLWLKLAQQNKIISKPEKLLKYRISSTSLSQRVNKNVVDKNAMVSELFATLFENMSELSIRELASAFGGFLNRYLRSSARAHVMLAEKSFLIYFLLLSHNNPDLRHYSLKKLHRDRLIDKYSQFLKENIRM